MIRSSRALLASALLAAAAPPQAPAPAAAASAAPRIEWQRSLADALAVQKETGLPLLLVVNMDGEVFNDRFAGEIYRSERFVELTRGYVCIVAGPDRHNERDYDAHGNRIECPRFHGCTCSEHIGVEPELFARYFNGQRAAPRHVGVGKDGRILFDRFLDTSMQTAIDAVAEHRGRPKADRLPAETKALLRLRSAAARRAIEERYRAGDRAARIALLDAARDATSEPFDLLRMALRDDDDAVFTAGAVAIARIATPAALIDVEDALARVVDPAVEAALVARLQAIATGDKSAARLASHFAPAKEPAAVAAPWSNEWRPPAFDATSRGSIEAELDRREAELGKKPQADDSRLGLAIAQAALGALLAQDRAKGVELWLQDAARNAGKVANEALRPEADAVLAVAAWMTGDTASAAAPLARAQAVAAADLRPDAWLAARMLEVLVQSTAQTAYAAASEDATAGLRAHVDRVRAALDLSAARGAVAEGPQLAGIGLLEYAGLRREARDRLRALVAAFPASAAVHERWRNRVLIDLGAEALRREYARFADAAADAATAQWFAGYAALVAAEQHTRDARGGEAAAAYGEAVDRFARSAAANADFADSANHFAVLALGGRASLRHAAGDGEGAVADVLAAARLRPASLDESDGLARKPRAIAGRIARELTAAGKTDLAAKLADVVR